MKLTSVKLAGFKSFVDPTTIPITGNLTGIVGPNGCGKSNVIDAVRWVMGESSAKYLRGDSMADVIFNGSSARKPVGQASIELFFDNSDGQVGGQFAGFTDISVRRVVTRDGTSDYYLNGSRCRRKDITNLFLGTGLGPRSYAIIEQGMISKLIEAKPEDLRVFLEEAAGISKYKARRRETENRIKHTRENLARLNDLRDEVDKQLKHLEKQKRTAERYTKLQNEKRQLEAELLVLRLQKLEHENAGHTQKIEAAQQNIDESLALLRNSETEIKESRTAREKFQGDLTEIQEQFYSLGAEVARIEQDMTHHQSQLERQERELLEVNEQHEALSTHLASEGGIGQFTSTIAGLKPELIEAQSQAESASMTFQDAEVTWRDADAKKQSFVRQHQEAGQAFEIARTRLEQLKNQQRLFQAQQTHQGSEDASFDWDQELRELENLSARFQSLHDEAEQLGQKVAQSEQALVQEQKTASRLEQEISTLRAELANIHGQSQSLNAIIEQEDKAQQPFQEWLAKHGWQDQPTLWQSLTVDPMWQAAVEMVLSPWLHAMSIADEAAIEALTEVQSGQAQILTFSEQSVVVQADSLAAKVQGPEAVKALLNPVRLAGSFESALAMRDTLGPGESIVTPDGIWLGRAWMCMNRSDSNEHNILARRETLETLAQETVQKEQKLTELSALLESTIERVATMQSALTEARQQWAESKQSASQCETRTEERQRHADQMRNKVLQQKREQDELARSLETTQWEIQECEKELARCEQRKETLQAQAVHIEANFAQADRVLNETREQLTAQNTAVHTLKTKIETQEDSQATAANAIERLHEQLKQLEQRATQLNEQITAHQQPLLELTTSLSQKQSARSETEQRLASVRQQLEDTDTQLREQDEQRLLADQTVQTQKTILNELQLGAQESRVRHETVMEQFAQTDFELAELQASLSEDAEFDTWQAQCETVTQKINRLGPINLASIEEFDELEERKTYLDTQNGDLEEAMETLEKAIGKIDKETRSRFKETFDKVNEGLQELFPRLFGGGAAYLELDDNDLLNTGVTIMARPPGKRNSTIHLLSGGEKALTAVALVFSIFQLNPAPFCLLDEVDAPLDENNVIRFSELVKEMSAHVQFVVITHNKSTMEMMDRLAGVTMQEPGVSRLVAVDLDEAVQMAAM